MILMTEREKANSTMESNAIALPEVVVLTLAPDACSPAVFACHWSILG
jgi:hypothetical protein